MDSRSQAAETKAAQKLQYLRLIVLVRCHCCCRRLKPSTLLAAVKEADEKVHTHTTYESQIVEHDFSCLWSLWYYHNCIHFILVIFHHIIDFCSFEAKLLWICQFQYKFIVIDSNGFAAENKYVEIRLNWDVNDGNEAIAEAALNNDAF